LVFLHFFLAPSAGNANVKFASFMPGVPLEIISKVLLRHQNLRTTQVYLGRVTDVEALRWMDILYG